jgi:spermidine synthase
VGLWFTERQLTEEGRETLSLGMRIKSVLHRERSQFQELVVMDSDHYGRVLILDNVIQTTEKDEFVYHEMITHIPMFTHPNPRQVLVIGGGDGGTVREVLKHDSVEKVELCEIDRRVCEVSKQYLPGIGGKLDDPRVKAIYEDGIQYVQGKSNAYDVIIVDAPDPEGPAVGLFEGAFYASIHAALKPDGLFSAQTESPFHNAGLMRKIHRDIHRVFPTVKAYLAFIPTYQSGMWSFALGSKQYDPEGPVRSGWEKIETKYYTPSLHHGCFILPGFVEEIIR